MLMSGDFATQTMKYTFCPNCGQMSVSAQSGTSGEYMYTCHRECDFSFIAALPTLFDRENERRWREQQLISAAERVMLALKRCISSSEARDKALADWQSIIKMQAGVIDVT